MTVFTVLIHCISPAFKQMLNEAVSSSVAKPEAAPLPTAMALSACSRKLRTAWLVQRTCRPLKMNFPKPPSTPRPGILVTSNWRIFLEENT